MWTRLKGRLKCKLLSDPAPFRDRYLLLKVAGDVGKHEINKLLLELRGGHAFRRHWLDIGSFPHYTEVSGPQMCNAQHRYP